MENKVSVIHKIGKKGIAELQSFLASGNVTPACICQIAYIPPYQNRKNERFGSHMRGDNLVLSYIKAVNKFILCFINIQFDRIIHGNRHKNAYLLPHVLCDSFAIYKYSSSLPLKTSCCTSKQHLLLSS
jgi:hypothetical protein